MQVLLHDTDLSSWIDLWRSAVDASQQSYAANMGTSLAHYQLSASDETLLRQHRAGDPLPPELENYRDVFNRHIECARMETRADRALAIEERRLISTLPDPPHDSIIDRVLPHQSTLFPSLWFQTQLRLRIYNCWLGFDEEPTPERYRARFGAFTNNDLTPYQRALRTFLEWDVNRIQVSVAYEHGLDPEIVRSIGLERLLTIMPPPDEITGAAFKPEDIRWINDALIALRQDQWRLFDGGIQSPDNFAALQSVERTLE